MQLNATIFGQAITFSLFVWFTKAYVWPPLMQALTDRRAKIAEGLEQAERSKLELQQAHTKAEAILEAAKQQSQLVLTAAQADVEHILTKGKEQAEQQAKFIIKDAEAQAEKLEQLAIQNAKAKLAELIVLGAEQLLRHNVADKKQAKLIAELLDA